MFSEEYGEALLKVGMNQWSPLLGFPSSKFKQNSA